MKKIYGWFKAYDSVEVEDNATEQEIRQKLAESMGFDYFTTVSPDEVEEFSLTPPWED